jgi:hypothetical protein
MALQSTMTAGTHKRRRVDGGGGTGDRDDHEMGEESGDRKGGGVDMKEFGGRVQKAYEKTMPVVSSSQGPHAQRTWAFMDSSGGGTGGGTSGAGVQVADGLPISLSALEACLEALGEHGPAAVSMTLLASQHVVVVRFESPTASAVARPLMSAAQWLRQTRLKRTPIVSIVECIEGCGFPPQDMLELSSIVTLLFLLHGNAASSRVTPTVDARGCYELSCTGITTIHLQHLRALTRAFRTSIDDIVLTPTALTIRCQSKSANNSSTPASVWVDVGLFQEPTTPSHT